MENHVVSLELAKKLKTLGVEQKSEFYYCVSVINGNTNYDLHQINPKSTAYSDYISAFLASELAELLPEGCVAWKTCEGHYLPKKYDLIDGEVKGAFTSSMHTDDWSMANVYACMLIHLKETNGKS